MGNISKSEYRVPPPPPPPPPADEADVVEQTRLMTQRATSSVLGFRSRFLSGARGPGGPALATPEQTLLGSRSAADLVYGAPALAAATTAATAAKRKPPVSGSTGIGTRTVTR